LLLWLALDSHDKHFVAFYGESVFDLQAFFTVDAMHPLVVVFPSIAFDCEDNSQ
jgi:hypothetical protein